MTFDMQKAREACTKLYLPWSYFEPDDQIHSQLVETEYGEYGTVIGRYQEEICQFLGEARSSEIISGVNSLPAALDEIERQIKTIDGYANAVYSANGRIDAQAKQIEDRNLIIGHMQAAIEAQAKRIAGSEEENRRLVRQIMTDDDKDRLIAKQHAALKKLGQAKRARGKALVEERARSIHVPCKFDDAVSICDYSGSDTGWCKNCSQKDKIRKIAREELRQEGKL